MTTASIVICTRNGTAQFKSTLQGLGRVKVPCVMSCELVKMANGSTDCTAEVVESTRLPKMPVRCLYETDSDKSPGLNFAYRSVTARGKL